MTRSPHTSDGVISKLDRREWLGRMAAAGGAAVATTLAAKRLSADEPSATAQWVAATLDYLERHRRDDGGYAWADQKFAHLTPTFAVVGAYHALGSRPPRPHETAEFVRTHNPHRLKSPERVLHAFRYQQLQALAWLGEEGSPLESEVRKWTRPGKFPTRYERSGYPVLAHELMIPITYDQLGLKAPEVAREFAAYLAPRRRENGSYNNTPAHDGDGHVASTLRALWAWKAIERISDGQVSDPAATAPTEPLVEWLRACQLPSGGFTWRPKADIGGVDDAYYTWAAVEALALLDARPANVAACLDFLASLATGDGGFADRVGWEANPMATFQALGAIARLSARENVEAPLSAVHMPTAIAAKVAARGASKKPSQLHDGLRVFSAQVESHGRGSPSEAVEIARALKIHLWGAKNALPGWLEKAQSIADERGAEVTFFAADEEYGTFIDVPGLGVYSHMVDIMAPAGAAIGEPMAGDQAPTWREFADKRLAPLEKAGGRLVWQFGENDDLTRILIDDSIERGTGFAAVSTFHFGNPDFTNSQPCLYRWRGELPFVGLQDAHGNEPWWFIDRTLGFRTLFLATSPTYEEWLRALDNDWVVSVRHDEVSGQETWMHGGASGVQEAIMWQRERWCWWEGETRQVDRPWASVVAVSRVDEFEAARPERGVAIRVRCWWDNTVQGQPKTERARLVKLTVDGAEVETKQTRAGRGAPSDIYDVYVWEDPPRGAHVAVATVESLATRERRDVSTNFAV